MMADRGPAASDVEKGFVRQDTSCSSLPSPDTALGSPKSVSSSLARLWRPSNPVSNVRDQDAKPKRWWWSIWRRDRRASSTGEGSEDFVEEDPRKLVVRRLQDCPDGYPKLGAFLDSDDNFMVYRRFGYLQSRLLLDNQEHLRRLEEELENLDEEDEQAKSRNLITMENYDSERYKPRRLLMERIENQFQRYASLLRAARSLTHCNRPSSGEYKSVENFINNRKPLVPTEQSFIYHKEDLITLRPGREHAWLDRSVEKLLRTSRCRMIQDLFRSKETKEKTDGIEKYYTRQRIERFVVTLIVLMILALLVVPIYLLYQLTNGVESARSTSICIAILLVFTLSFSACLSLFTRAKRHEILAAAAAYCAVLVVFFTNVGGSETLRSSLGL